MTGKFGQTMRGFMVKLPGMIDCEQFENFLLAYIEDELTPSQRKVINLHLRVCPDCRRYVADYRRTLEALKVSKVEDDGALADVPEDLIQAILKASAV
jgi:predicted anti-sigma-YlaC factor YlaD